MTIYRQIYVKMWSDAWVLDLDPLDKLLFTYLFSNDRTNLIGLYDISLKKVAFETGLDMEQVKSALARFSKSGKVYYEDGLIWVVNLLRHNAKNIASGRVFQHIKNCWHEIPDCPIKRRALDHYNLSVTEQYRIDTLCIPIRTDPYPYPETEPQQEQETDPFAAAAAPSSPRAEEPIPMPDAEPKPATKDPKAPPVPLSDGLTAFLELFNARRFANRTQRDTVARLEEEHGRDKLLEVGRWAAKMGMPLGKAIASVETAIPKWGQARAGPSPGKNGRASPRFAQPDYEAMTPEQRRAGLTGWGVCPRCYMSPCQCEEGDNGN